MGSSYRLDAHTDRRQLSTVKVKTFLECLPPMLLLFVVVTMDAATNHTFKARQPRCELYK